MGKRTLGAFQEKRTIWKRKGNVKRDGAGRGKRFAVKKGKGRGRKENFVSDPAGRLGEKRAREGHKKKGWRKTKEGE